MLSPCIASPPKLALNPCTFLGIAGAEVFRSTLSSTLLTPGNLFNPVLTSFVKFPAFNILFAVLSASFALTLPTSSNSFVSVKSLKISIPFLISASVSSPKLPAISVLSISTIISFAGLLSIFCSCTMY